MGLDGLNTHEFSSMSLEAPAAMKTAAPELQYLNLYKSDLVTSSWITKLAEQLPDFSGLKGLNLSRGKLEGEAGGAAVARLIRNTSALERVDLSYNVAFGVDGFNAFAAALEDFSLKINYLNVRDCGISDTAVDLFWHDLWASLPSLDGCGPPIIRVLVPTVCISSLEICAMILCYKSSTSVLVVLRLLKVGVLLLSLFGRPNTCEVYILVTIAEFVLQDFVHSPNIYPMTHFWKRYH